MLFVKFLICLSLFCTAINASSPVEETFLERFLNLVFRSERFPSIAPRDLEATKESLRDCLRTKAFPIPLTSNDGFSRGYCSSHTDPFFLQVLGYASTLAIEMKEPPVAYDFGAALGITTGMLCLVGCKAHGIEKAATTKAELATMFSIFKTYTLLIAPYKLSGGLKYNTCDAFDLPAKDFPFSSADIIFLGNFLHMFDVRTASLFIANVVSNLTKPKAKVFCTVDGAGLENSGNFLGLPVLESAQTSPKAVYLDAKRRSEKFPGMMVTKRLVQKVQRSSTATEYVALGVLGIEHDDTNSIPCRIAQFTDGADYEDFSRSCGYTGDKKHLFVETILFSHFDQSSLESVFPAKDWKLELLRRGPLYQTLNDTVADEHVISWAIIATKI